MSVKSWIAKEAIAESCSYTLVCNWLEQLHISSTYGCLLTSNDDDIDEVTDEGNHTVGYLNI